MPNNILQPYFEPYTRPTGYCTAAVRGKRLVVVSATPPGGMAGTENPRVAECGTAGAICFAVAVYDGAVNESIPLLRGTSSAPLVAGAAVTAGQALMSDTQGRVIPWTTGNHKIGIALEDQAVVGSDVGVALNL